jgi:hypothetical protein
MRSSTRAGRSARSFAGALCSLAVVAAIVGACGAAASVPTAAGGGAVGEGDGALPAASAGGGGSDVGGSGSGGASQGGSGQGGNDGQIAIVDAARIVRTGSLQLTVSDVGKALTGARAAVESLGGYIGASQQQRDGDKVVASVTYRIPAGRWEEALDDLRALGTEVGEKTDATEVTGQLVDLDARIRNLKASETALVGYAQQAPKVSDLLEVQARLSDTRGEIERLTAQQTQLQNQAALATLTVTFGTETVAVVETAQRWDPAGEVDRASATLIGIGQGLVSVAIVFGIVWLPLILAVAVVAAIVLLVARRFGWTRPNRLPPMAPPPMTPPMAPPPGSAEF